MSDNDLEKRLQMVRSRQQEALRTRAQAEAKLDSLKAQRQQHLNTLNEMGFPTPEDAVSKVREIQAETEAILADIESKVRSV